MGWSIRKPLGGRNSIVRQTVSHPVGALAGSVFGLPGSVLGALAGGLGRTSAPGGMDNSSDPNELDALASAEEAKRKALGQQQRQQILGFADETQGRAANFRTGLAQSLSDTGQQFFKRLNPAILEDLNSRGLFTSQTARDQEQSQALGDIARENENSLRAFDTDMFNKVNDIRGTALSSELGGDQSALDSALALRKGAIQRRFDETDATREQNFANMLSKRQSRDSLIASLLGLGGRLGAASLAGG
jgi:hypothetical protein